jgi:hypothetical protein
MREQADEFASSFLSLTGGFEPQDLLRHLYRSPSLSNMEDFKSP